MHGYWALIQEQPPFAYSRCQLILKMHHNNADAHLKLILSNSDAHTSDLHYILFAEASVAWVFHPMVSPISIGRCVSALPSRADTASHAWLLLWRGGVRSTLYKRMVDNDSTTLMWFIKSLQKTHIVSTKSIGRAIMRMEHPQPPTSGITTAIGRWVVLTSLPMSIDGGVSSALINFPGIFIIRVEFKSISTSCDIELQGCEQWGASWPSSGISRGIERRDSSTST